MHDGIQRGRKKIRHGKHGRAGARPHRRLAEQRDHFRRAFRGELRRADVIGTAPHNYASAEIPLVALFGPHGQTELQR